MERLQCGENQRLIEFNSVIKDYPLLKNIFGRVTKVHRAVSDLSFYVHKGKSVGIVGESGSGKTTVCRLMLGLAAPTKGSILYKGKSIFSLHGEELRSFKRDIQAVFQNPFSSLDPRMRIGEIVGEPLLAQKKVSKKELKERISVLLELCGLRGDDMNRYPHQFSGGQRQRIAIARAISSDAQLIVLDEPVSSLDVSIRAQILNLFKKLQKEFHLAYVFVAHDLATVYYMCDGIIVMYLGKAVETGPSDQIFSKPAHPYTQALLNAILVPSADYRMPNMIMSDLPVSNGETHGCLFAVRCKHSFDRCLTEEPINRRIDMGHFVACHLYSTSWGNDVLLGQ